MVIWVFLNLYINKSITLERIGDILRISVRKVIPINSELLYNDYKSEFIHFTIHMTISDFVKAPNTSFEKLYLLAYYLKDYTIIVPEIL